MPRITQHPTTTPLAVILLLIAGCGNHPPNAAPVGTQAPVVAEEEIVHETAVALPTATLPDGSVVKLELSTTPEEISNGLMYRPSLPADRGMLFIFDQARLPSFWMKNTLISLDIVFLDATGVVVDVVADAQPCTVDPCPQYVPQQPATAVLELAAGASRAHDIVTGSQLAFALVPGYPTS